MRKSIGEFRIGVNGLLWLVPITGLIVYWGTFGNKNPLMLVILSFWVLISPALRWSLVEREGGYSNSWKIGFVRDSNRHQIVKGAVLAL